MASKNYQSIPTARLVDDRQRDNDDGLLLVQGEVQPPAFRDPFFGVLFWIQILVVLLLSVLYANGSIEVDWEKGRRLETTDVLAPYAIGCLNGLFVGPILTVGTFSLLYHHAIPLLQLSMYLAIGINVLLTILLLLLGAFGVALFTGLGAVLSWCYARAVWNRIPLAAANLKTAVSSIRSQLGLAFLGVASFPCYLLWWALWVYFFVCSLHTNFMKAQVESTKIVHTSGPNADDDFVNTLDEQYSGLWWFLVFLMLVSFYWTTQVIHNTIQATVAGAVGTFWFVPQEATGCCSQALVSSLSRSLTYSFGSICMGSLIVAIVQALRELVRQAEESARRNREGSAALLLCLLQCLLSTLESIAEYFNKWAFIYVGLYGYPYIEAGKNVLTLFRQRGWSTIITDSLTARVLGMVAFAIALVTGLIGGIIGGLGSLSSSVEVEGVAGVSWFVSFILGIILANVIFAVVHSAADTVVVLFAEAPAEFVQNHPELAHEMNRAWSSAYPDIFRPIAPTIVV